MLCELSQEEIQHIERYRDLTEEFQKALDAQAKVLFDLQTNIFKELIKANKEKGVFGHGKARKRKGTKGEKATL